MADYAPDAFTLFSTFNKSKIEGKTDEFWSKAEWPVEQIEALYNWALTQDPQPNQKGEMCVTVNQKLLPRTSAAGNDYLLGITSGKAATEVPF
jgi:hypothetical protein